MATYPLRLEVGVKVELLCIALDQHLGFDEYTYNLDQQVLRNASSLDQLIQCQAVVVVVLDEDSHLIRASHQDVLLVEGVRPQLVLRVVP